MNTPSKDSIFKFQTNHCEGKLKNLLNFKLKLIKMNSQQVKFAIAKNYGIQWKVSQVSIERPVCCLPLPGNDYAEFVGLFTFFVMRISSKQNLQQSTKETIVS